MFPANEAPSDKQKGTDSNVKTYPWGLTFVLGVL